MQRLARKDSSCCLLHNQRPGSIWNPLNDPTGLRVSHSSVSVRDLPVGASGERGGPSRSENVLADVLSLTFGQERIEAGGESVVTAVQVVCAAAVRP